MTQTEKAFCKTLAIIAMIAKCNSTFNLYEDGECSGPYCALEILTAGLVTLGMLSTGVVYNTDGAEDY